MNALAYAMISACGNAANSLFATHVFRSKRLSAGGVTVLSLAPAFVIAGGWSPNFFASFSLNVALLMIAKNALYGLALFLRYRGLSRLGGFQGALMAASQPALVSGLSLAILGERLLPRQWISVILIAVALWPSAERARSDRRDVILFALMPALLLSLVVVMDRWMLTQALKPEAFFALDKLILFPVTLATLTFSRQLPLTLGPSARAVSETPLIALGLGLTWTLSSYTYGVSLAGEKTAVVTLIRNLAFPLAAIGSVALFNESLTRDRLVRLSLVVGACAIAL